MKGGVNLKNLQMVLLQIGEQVETEGNELDFYSREVECLPKTEIIETIKLIKYDGALWTIKKINGQIYDVSCSDLFTVH